MWPTPRCRKETADGIPVLSNYWSPTWRFVHKHETKHFKWFHFHTILCTSLLQCLDRVMLHLDVLNIKSLRHIPSFLLLLRQNFNNRSDILQVPSCISSWYFLSITFLTMIKTYTCTPLLLDIQWWMNPVDLKIVVCFMFVSCAVAMKFMVYGAGPIPRFWPKPRRAGPFFFFSWFEIHQGYQICFQNGLPGKTLFSRPWTRSNEPNFETVPSIAAKVLLSRHWFFF